MKLQGLSETSLLIGIRMHTGASREVGQSVVDVMHSENGTQDQWPYCVQQSYTQQ
jgi:hypothetical protein